MSGKIFSAIFCIAALTGSCSDLPVSSRVKISNNPHEARILFAGDVMLDWGIRDSILENGISYPIQYLKKFLSSFDYRFCNLECPISSKGKPVIDKQYVFNADPGHIELLKLSGINGVSLANNHSCDYGEEGLAETIKNLEAAGISATGAGSNMENARIPITVSINNIRIGILAYADPDMDGAYASMNRPGSAIARPELIRNDIRQYKEDHDFIVISMHWGNEYHEYPGEKIIKLAHQIIDAGADAVIGHHPHIFQGIEIYQGKPVFYSLGNFIFGSVNESAGNNILTEIIFSKDCIKGFRIFPVNGNGTVKTAFQYRILSGAKADTELKRLLEISKPFKSDFPDKAVIADSAISYTY